MTTRPLKQLLHERQIKPIDLARKLGVDKGSVSRWCNHRVPAERVLEIERATGIRRELMRPDLYPVDFPGSAAAGSATPGDAAMAPAE